jgi:hypothetical protein
MHDIPLWFLLLGLIFPRLTLLFTWLCGHIPYNDVPLPLDALGALILPRFLIAYYIATDIGTASPWFWAYVIVGVITFLTGGLRITTRS